MASGLAAELDSGRVSQVQPRPGSERLRELIDRHFEFVWRSLRRLGLGEADADDAAQEVFMVASRRLDDILAARERAFLFGTAMRVASTHRRRRSRRAELLDGSAEQHQDPCLNPEQAVGRWRARQLLDEVLDELPGEQRSVFLLFEFEQLSAPEIADLLDLPLGTVASRLRRARRAFSEAVQRLRARESFRWRSS